MKTITINVPDDCEVQIVRKEEKKESVIRTYQDLIDNRVSIEGAWINNEAHIQSYNAIIAQKDFTEDIARSEKVAKSMLAMAMISQLMSYYGGEITNDEWKRRRRDWFIIYREGNKIACGSFNILYFFLAFHTAEQRDEFLKYNEQLVKDYLMID